MRKRIALTAVGAALLVAPAVTQGQVYERTDSESVHADLNDTDWKPYETEYLRLHDRYAEKFGNAEAGRNIVLDGFKEGDGDVRDVRKPEVVESTGTLKGAFVEPEVAATETGATETGATAETTSAGGGYASSSTVQCESGGDYGAVNPAGYYGAYQFDQGTWDAYAPEGYQGTNPAEAPPAVQDAAAANVPYDAWPSC